MEEGIEHKGKEGEPMKPGDGGRKPFIVLGEAAKASRPSKGAFNDIKVPPIWWTGKAQISEKELQTCLQPIAPMTRTSVRKRSIFCSAADVRSSGWPQNSVLPPILYGPGGTGPSARGA